MFDQPPIQQVLDRFWRIAREQGARLLPEPCRPTELPPHGDATVPAYTTGCGGETRVAFGYEGEDGVSPDDCIVCATDDMAYHFPRFRSV